jgi:hypothetical protein
MDAKLIGPACACGDAFCSGCDEAIQDEALRATEDHGIMDHVVKCGSCEYTTNMIGDLTAHRKAYHPRQKGRI